MKLKINDKLLYIIFENKNEEKIINNFLTFEDNSSVFAGGSYNPMYAQKKHLGKIIKGIFICYAGFGREVIKYCKEMDLPITELKDERTKFKFDTEIEFKKYFDPKFKYIDHQIRALVSMLKTNTGIIKATTSAGKSYIFSAYIRITKMPTLIVVNKVTLAEQIQKKLINDGIDCGICHGKGYKSGDCMVSTIQSIKRVADLTKYQCLIVDEVHQGSSKNFQEFFGSVSYPYKFGFSATPYNGSDYRFALIRQFFGSIIEEIEAEELMENEVIAVPDISFIPIKCPQTMDWQSAYDQAIVHNKERNNKIADLAKEAILNKDQTLILISIIEHGAILNELLPEAIFVSGDTPTKERMRIIEEFDKGNIKTIISSNVFNEGISISNINVLIIASAKKGLAETSQKLGRALRITDDKKTAIVYDFLDNGNKYTERHSKRRMSIYKKNGFKVKLK